MRRISTATAVADLFGPGKPGFRDGDKAAGITPTDLNAEIMNGMQEEIVRVIEAAGIVPSEANLGQLLLAIQNIAAGGDYKASCRVATTGNLAALTGLLTIDGVVLVAGDRVLVKDQVAGAYNGIYVAAAGAWSRAADADTGAEINSGAIVSIESGTFNADTRWQLTTDGAVTIGTTALTFQITGLGVGYFLARDERPSGTYAGSAAPGSVVTRVLNTLSNNTIPGASLAANQVTLPAGTYRIRASCMSFNSNKSNARLYSVTDAANLIIGFVENNTNSVSTAGMEPGGSRTWVEGRVTLTSSKVLELRQYNDTSDPTGGGLGNPAASGVIEVYASFEAIKE